MGNPDKVVHTVVGSQNSPEVKYQENHVADLIKDVGAKYPSEAASGHLEEMKKTE